jgi:hypothetical protein
MTPMRRKAFFTVALFLLCIPSVSFAHIGAFSFEKIVDGKLVDIGYDILFERGEETLIDFGMFTLKDDYPDQLASFTRIEFSMYSGSTVMVSKSITKPEFGKAFAVVTPTRGGNWTFRAKFWNGDSLAADASFEVPIKGSSTPLNISGIAVVAVLVAIIGGTMTVFLRRHS